jgi:hypothetical protein
MHNSFKIIKFVSLYAARHVSDTIVSIIRSFLLLYMQSLVTYQITNIVSLHDLLYHEREISAISLYHGQCWKHSSTHQTTRRHNPKYQHHLKPNNTFRKVKVLEVSIGKHRAGVPQVLPARLGYAAGGHKRKVYIHVHATKITEFGTLGTPFIIPTPLFHGPGLLRRYSDSLRAGRSGDWILVGARFSAPFQTGPGADPASYTRGYQVPFSKGKAAGAWRSPPTSI